MVNEMNWVERESQNIDLLFDFYIAFEASYLYQQIAETEPDPASKINQAFQAFSDLINGEMPIYDKWIALFYALWYQPKQINVAYRAINAKLENVAGTGRPLLQNDSLRVLDFGCGSLATQFGVALALADAIDRGEDVSSVEIYAADTSAAMIELGGAIWNDIRQTAGTRPEWFPLARAFEVIESHTHVVRNVDEFVGKVPRSAGTETWVSALHCVYHENISEIQRALRMLVNNFHPDFGFATSYSRKANLVHRASQRFDLADYRVVEPNLRGGLTGTLGSIAQRRIQVLRDYGGKLDPLTRNFLHGEPIWEPQATYYRLFFKR